MTTIEVSQHQDSAEAVAARAELIFVDPAELIVGANTRAEVQLDKVFLASVKARGVREPIAVRRDAEGRLVVRKGQRRALAAVEAGLAVVPVVVEPELLEGSAAEIDRIVDQLGENQHRAPIAEREEVAAHQQLQAFGLTAAQIARRTSTAAKRVRTSLAVGDSEVAAAAMGRYELTLDQAAVVAEFGGEEETVTALVAAARKDPGQFPHVAQRARDARAERELRQRLTDELVQQGIRVIDQPERYLDGPTRKLDVLRAPGTGAEDGGEPEPGPVLTPETHLDCPGRVAWLARLWQHDGPPVVVVHGCEDWEQHGHVGRDARQPTLGYGPRTGKLSEAEKAERRVVRSNNEAWRSATTVRRDWLRQFLARKSAPKDAAVWTAVALAESRYDLGSALQKHHSYAQELLGVAGSETERWSTWSRTPHPIADAAAKSTPARAAVLTLAVLLGAHEDACSTDTWRNPSADARRYFAALRNWGYELSDVERLVLGEQPDETEEVVEVDEEAGTQDADAA